MDAPDVDGLVGETWDQIRKRAYKTLLTEWNEIWMTGGNCRQTKIFIGRIDETLQDLTINMSRRDLGLFVRLVTGHNGLNHHLNIMGQSLSLIHI